MKTIWNIICILAVGHMLAIMAFLGYLAASDRISSDRLEEARQLFAMTVAQEAAAKQAEAKATAKADAAANSSIAQLTQNGDVVLVNGRDARFDAPSEGAAERYEQLQTVDEMLRERELRYEKDREHLMRTLESEYRKLEKGWEELNARQDAFRAEVERQRRLREDEQFQKMVNILKGLPGEALKGKFDAYLASGDASLVVDILDAFDKRTAQKVIKEYQTDTENALAADLLKRLKDRGLNPDAP